MTNQPSSLLGGMTKVVPPSRATSAPPRRRTRRIARRWKAWAFLAPVAIYMVLFYAYPLGRNVELSVHNYNIAAFVTGVAEFVGLENYVRVITSSTFVPALTQTAVFTLVSVFFQFSLGLALAVFFYRKFPLSMTLRALFLIPWLLPLIVSASTWSRMMNSDYGVLNVILGTFGIPEIHWLTSSDSALASVILVCIWLGIPFNLVILYSGLQNIPEEIYEASLIDGASPWQTFWQITFPLLRPVAAIAILLGLVYTLKTFDIIWIMTRGGPGSASTTLATWSYQLGFGSSFPQFSPAAAVGNTLVVLALIIGAIYAVSRRRLEDV